MEFRDYVQFINKIAGVKSTYSLSDISERIMGELSGIVAEAVLEGRQNVGLNALVSLQANSRRLAKQMCAELDKELSDIGMGVADLNILSINYPPEVQKMAEKVASQALCRTWENTPPFPWRTASTAPTAAGISRPWARRWRWASRWRSRWRARLSPNRLFSSRSFSGGWHIRLHRLRQTLCQPGKILHGVRQTGSAGGSERSSGGSVLS